MSQYTDHRYLYKYIDYLLTSITTFLWGVISAKYLFLVDVQTYFCPQGKGTFGTDHPPYTIATIPI